MSVRTVNVHVNMQLVDGATGRLTCAQVTVVCAQLLTAHARVLTVIRAAPRRIAEREQLQ